MKIDFKIVGMTCSACSSAVEKAVKRLEGVEDVSVSLLENMMTVHFDEDALGPADISTAVKQAGYEAFVETSTTDETIDNIKNTEINLEHREMKTRLIVSISAMIPLMYIAMGPMIGMPMPSIFTGSENGLVNALTQLLLTIPIVFVNRKYYLGGLKAMLRRAPNMDSLIAIGSGSALIYGIFVIYVLAYAFGRSDHELIHRYMHSLYFESAAMILTLITLGKYLESRSKGRTTDAIKKLMDLSPKTAIRVIGDREEEIPIEAVVVDDELIVKPGSTIPVDGVVISGIGSVDQSAISGESIPVEVYEGSKVIGSTILQLGSLKIRAEKVGKDTTLAKIIQLVQDANRTKAPIAKLADQISSVFVPVVIAISFLAMGVWLYLGQSFEFSLSIGIAVLVISCPCALGLATPVAIMVGTGRGAAEGILFKSAESLENLHEVKHIILDKTGTITEGKPAVTDIIPLGIDEKQLLMVAGALEEPSEHPLSTAILDYVREWYPSYPKATGFINILGRGIRGSVEGEEYFGGNLRFMKEEGIPTVEAEEIGMKLSAEGKTPLYFSDGRSVIGIIAAMDRIKEGCPEAVMLLKKRGMQVHMLTGDNERTAEVIRKKVDIEHMMADVLPQDKEEEVRQLKASGQKVAMVGDGINDAPALARADVGVAIGAGADIAIEAAEVVLIKSDLLDVVNAIDLSKKTIRNIKENLFWAFFYNILCIPLAAGAFYPSFGLTLNPMIASAAMSVSSIFVVTNALRLNRFKAKVSRVRIETNNRESEYNKTLKGEKDMVKKIIKIEGMSCSHCSGRVEKALNAAEGVKAIVYLERAEAEVEVPESMTDMMLREIVEGEGYTVVGIS